ncbi:HxlR family transcriptional regulator [Calothrix sp. NIES-4071]|nr:HxlR family transcriptional regulator [Calothrix sp. NIES-4071]BAZ60988.1 HxlR family transcriptional regulator [Calothrix sp. NIES-4105]
MSNKSTSCPITALTNLLIGPWTLYILWILRSKGPTRFGALKRQIEGISSKVLTEKLRMLEEAEVIYRVYEPTIPPQVTYGLTERAQDLIIVLDQLEAVAHKWYAQEQSIKQ